MKSNVIRYSDYQKYRKSIPKKRIYTPAQTVRFKWSKMLSEDGYNILATIKKPMKHPYVFEENMWRIGQLEQVEKMFYSVEKNTEGGYHLHLMLKAYKTNKRNICYVANLLTTDITYWAKVQSKYRVASYVTKYMIGDQIHYNYY
tara:strand:- start:88 stop:522 length:435 start_codon:yes stop_codon:yes gene_type:complete